MGITLARDYPEKPFNRYMRRLLSKYWTIDYNALMVATVVPIDDRGFVVTGQWRTNADFLGVRWDSEDRFDHEWFKYSTDNNYRDTVLAFRANPPEPGKFTCTLTIFDTPYTYRLAPYVFNTDTNLWECLEPPEYGTGKTYGPDVMRPQSEWTAIPDDADTAVVEYYDRTDYIYILDFNDLRLYSTYTGPRMPSTDIARISFDTVERTNGMGRDAQVTNIVTVSSTTVDLSVANVQQTVRLAPGDTLQVLWTYDDETGVERVREDVYTVQSYTGFGSTSYTVRCTGTLSGRTFKASNAIYSRFLSITSPVTVINSEKYFVDMTLTGNRTEIAVRDYPQDAHDLMMTSGFDDGYNLTPERHVDMVYALGYRGFWTTYIGMSHYFNGRTAYQDIATGEIIQADGVLSKGPNDYYFIGQLYPFAPDADNRPVNAATMRWYKRFFELLHARGFEFINSVAYEILDFFMPESWKQRTWDGQPAQSGWSPPSSFIQCTNQAALHYVSEVQIQIIEQMVATGIAPRFQIGEPWWWDGSYNNGTSKNSPCIYDSATLELYYAETGQYAPTPYIKNIFDVLDPVQYPFVDWLCDKLGQSTNKIRDNVKARFPDALGTLLFFTPQIMSPSSELTKRLNFPVNYWKTPNYDFVQIEDYDWIIDGNLNLVPLTFDAAYERLGYPRSVVHYFTGFILKAQDYHIWQWIDKAIRMAKEANMPYIYVWSYTQAMRDSILYTDLPPAPLNARIVDLPVNWKSAYQVTRTFKTDILVSRGKKEQRRALRQTARKTVEYAALFGGADQRRVEAFVIGRQAYPFFIPDRVTQVHTTTDIAGDAITVSLDAMPGWIQLGTVVILSLPAVNGVAARMAARVVDKIDGLSLDFKSVDPDGLAWPAGTTVSYALYTRLSSNTSVTRRTSNVTEVNLTLEVVPGSEPAPWNPPVASFLWKNHELFPLRPNWAKDVDASYSAPIEAVDYGVGLVNVYNPVGFNGRTTKYTFLARNASEIQQVIDFFERMKGMQGVFWIPTWTNDLSLDRRSVAGNTIYFEGSELADYMQQDSIHQELAITSGVDGSITLVSIEDIARVDDNTTGVILSQAVSQQVLDDSVKWSWLLLCRLASDSLTIEYNTSTVAQFDLTATALQVIDASADNNIVVPSNGTGGSIPYNPPVGSDNVI